MSSEHAPTGIVRSVVAGQARIEVGIAGCAGCGRKTACGVGRLAGDRRPLQLVLPAPAGLAAGDVVTLNLAPAALLRAAALGYLLPAALTVAGGVLGNALASPSGYGDPGAALGLLLGLGLGLAASRRVRPAPPQLARKTG